MEKDEKIRRRQGRQTQVLVLGVVVLLVLGIGLVSIQTHDHDSGTAPHHSLSNIRHHNSALLAHHETATKVEHSLADIRQHSAIAKEDHAHDGHADKKVLNSIRRHVHHPPESDVEAEVVLVERVAAYDAQVRLIKDKVTADGGFMETDPAGVAATQALQEATRLLLVRRYGVKEGIRVQVDLAFQPSNPTYSDARGPTDRFTLELAPRTLMPHAVYTFLEIARQWDTHQGAFHRNANHVLQVLVKGNAVPHLAFQEYSPDFPHARGTVGYAGRPSGPAWYVSILDNRKNHGPGSQQARNPHEADACFGTVVEGLEEVVVARVHAMPGMGFLKQEMHVKITKMTIMVLDEHDTYVEWQPPSPS